MTQVNNAAPVIMNVVIAGKKSEETVFPNRYSVGMTDATKMGKRKVKMSLIEVGKTTFGYWPNRQMISKNSMRSSANIYKAGQS